MWTVDGDVARRMSLVVGWSGPDRPDYASINGDLLAAAAHLVRPA